MIGWIILAVYVLGFVLSWRSITYFWFREFRGIGEPETWDIVMAMFFGSFCALFWPIIVPARICYWLVSHHEDGFVGFITPRNTRRERELKERERRIERLERELGMTGLAERKSDSYYQWT